MEFRKLGSSQVEVPVIGLGTWKYGGGIEPLRIGIDFGASLIDTAEIYGTEEIVGQAIRGLRDRVFIVTKVAPRHFQRSQLIAAANNSLRRLNTEYIDLYQLHWPNYTVPIEETMAAMETLVDTGKIRFIGVSNFSVRDLKNAEKALSKYKIVANQVRYSLIDRSVEEGLLEYCHEKQITVIAYSPLGTGLLKIKAADPQRILPHVAQSVGRTEVQVALNWVIAKNNIVAIPKASTASHVIEDCQSGGWRLSSEAYGLLGRGVRSTRRGQTTATLARWKRHANQRLGRQL
jgi:diketogulonate reductase-like aldo/keto reductase